MNDTTGNPAGSPSEVDDEALLAADVFTGDYASYDETEARRRIALRVVGHRKGAAARRPAGGALTYGVAAAGSRVPPSRAERQLVLDAACHVRAARALDQLARDLVDSSEFTRVALDAEAWPYSRPSALLFASLLHLSGRMEGAQFWFQYAAGAGSATAARALYLLHLSRAEVTIAHHWQEQTTSPTNDVETGLPALPPIPEDLESPLGASVIWSSPPISTTDLAAHPPTDTKALRQFPPPLHRAMTALVPREDIALGEVYRTTSQLASALARCARLAPAGLTADAKQGARIARRAPRRPTCSSLDAAHRALRVLEVVHRHIGGVRLTQITRETGLGQLHLNQALQQLVRAQLATPITPGVYAAGSALQLAATDRDRMGELRDTLGYLRDAVGAAVYVASYTEGDVSITQYADGPRTPAVHEWVDFREAAHASAVGKALLAQLGPDERLDHLKRYRMEQFTPHTITNREILFDELDDRGPGQPLLDLQEYTLGTVCAAVPIGTGTEPQCVALSLPTPDPDRLQQAARVLRNEAVAVVLALLVAGEDLRTSAGPAAGRR
ncbi:IclR family transcriptional regulator C-terminal domain-containing protein [Streptomyces sp. NPDC044571]|uniref:IclR family transcriptional regulator n=1 Tax=Streptomyces sp. NPDC044571 TaxID=3155371 RepID=UPI0033EA9319